jgi:hypothetical protein
MVRFRACMARGESLPCNAPRQYIAGLHVCVSIYTNKNSSMCKALLALLVECNSHSIVAPGF